VIEASPGATLPAPQAKAPTQACPKLTGGLKTQSAGRFESIVRHTFLSGEHYHVADHSHCECGLSVVDHSRQPRTTQDGTAQDAKQSAVDGQPRLPAAVGFAAADGELPSSDTIVPVHQRGVRT
jgi:hypothetical protein